MTRIMASETGLTEIGYLGESGHRVIAFHDSIDLLKKYPQATVTILHQRKGDDIAYAVDSQYVSTANGIVEWTIQSADVAVAGEGQCELVFMQDGVIAKTLIYTTMALPSLNGAGEAPDPVKSWVEGIEESIAEKASATDTELQTTLSRGRKPDGLVWKTGEGSFAFGQDVIAHGRYSHAEGLSTKATDQAAHAEGSGTNAWSEAAHAEGQLTSASGVASHAEGYSTSAVGLFSHAEGEETNARGRASHAEGVGTSANGMYMHAQGRYNTLATIYPWWVPNTQYEVGDKVTDLSGIKWYICTTANHDSTFDISKWQYLPYNSDTAFTIGNGKSDTNRSNAFEVLWDGTAKAQTALQIGNTKITEAQLTALLALLN